MNYIHNFYETIYSTTEHEDVEICCEIELSLEFKGTGEDVEIQAYHSEVDLESLEFYKVGSNTDIEFEYDEEHLTAFLHKQANQDLLSGDLRDNVLEQVEKELKNDSL